MRRWRSYWVLLVPLAALFVFFPAYAKRGRALMSGPVTLRQLTFDDGGPLEVINEFAVASPDGRYFLLQHSEDPRLVERPDGSKVIDFKETSNWDIYRYRVDGSDKTQLTRELTSEDQPTWSPDSRTIVYRKLVGRTFDLFLMDADGRNQRPLLVDPVHDEKTPAFSRDGTKVVFFSDRDGVRWNLYEIDLTTRAVTRLTREAVDDKHPQYTPDGAVVFHSSRDARKVMLEGGDLASLMNLWLLSRAGQPPTQFSSTGEWRDNRHPWVSPDGKFVAYHSNLIAPDDRHPGTFLKRHRELIITRTDGRAQVNLTYGDRRNFKHPSWSADGKQLFFVFKERGKPWNAGVMDVTQALARLK